MNKLSKILALVISLALVIIPMAAGAETIDVTGVQITDPVLTMNDSPLMDLTGLTVQFAGGATEDGTLIQAFIDLFAGDTNANSALFQYDGTDLVAFLGGMQNAYKAALSAEIDVSGIANIDAESLTEMDELTEALESWTLPAEITALFNDFMTNSVTYGEPTTGEIEDTNGPVTMTYVPFSADATPLINDIMTLIDNDELLQKAIAASSTAGTEIPSFAELTQDMSLQIEGTMGTDETNSIVSYDMVLTSTSGDTTDVSNVTMLMKTADEGSVNLSTTVTSESTNQSCSIEMSTFENDVDFSLIMKNGDDVAGSFVMSLKENTFDMNLDMGEAGSFNMNLTTDSETSAASMTIDMTANGQSFQIAGSYTPTTSDVEGITSSGILEASYADDSASYALTCGVNTLVTQIDTDDFYIDPANAIDIETLTDEDTQAAVADLTNVLMSTLSTLESGVPGLNGLTEAIMSTYGSDAAVTDGTAEAPAEDTAEAPAEDTAE